MNLPRISLMAPARALALACGLLLPATAALADEYAEVQRLQRSGQTTEALARADKYIAANPRDPQMRFVKAGVLSAANKTAEAEELLVQLTRDYPELPEPWNNLAVLHASRGQLDKAQEALQAALRINPAYATALENLGDVRLRQASEAYQRARQIDPGNTRLAPKIEALRGALGTPAKPGGGRPTAARAGNLQRAGRHQTTFLIACFRSPVS